MPAPDPGLLWPEPANRHVAGRHVPQRHSAIVETRLHRAADGLGMRAARMEAAAGRRIDGIGRIANERRLALAAVRIVGRHGREQRARIGVARAGVDGVDRSRSRPPCPGT